MSKGHAFRLLGFPVTVSPGFLLGLLIVFAINNQSPHFALALVVALGVFTLLHELGHASAARAFGADAAISLNFLVGFAMYRPRRPLKSWERAAIAAAGPATEIALGTVALVFLGARPWSFDSVRHDALRLAIWWAGPMLGLINLLPIQPLDGGMIVRTGLERIAARWAAAIMQWWTIAVTAAAVALVLGVERFRPWLLTVLLFGFFNLREVMARPKKVTTSGPDLTGAALATEAEGWRSGRLGFYPPPYQASPWLRAHLLLEQHRAAEARDLLAESFASAQGTWVSPVVAGATPDQIRRLITLVPDPAPIEDPYASWVLQSALLHAGLARRSVEHGARVYDRYRLPAVAAEVARGLARSGEPDAAMGWLRAAYENEADVRRLDGDPGLDALRGRADFQELRARIAARVGA